MDPRPLSLGFLGPSGTFTEQALLTQADYADATREPVTSISEVLYRCDAGDFDVGFVAIENAIEGSVNATIDTLAFDTDLLIQREVIIDIEMMLLTAEPDTDISAVASIPIATAQCREYLRAQHPTAEILVANSTAEAAELVASGTKPGLAAIGTRRAAEVYGLTIAAADIEDHPGNQTRFVAVARSGVPAPTGHDKTSVVVFQHHDRPGSLLAILHEFAARSINLTKLESRPTRKGLGDYCFVIDLDGHIATDVVADCLRELHANRHPMKFLGSYPAAGDAGTQIRRDTSDAAIAAEAWLAELTRQIRPT